jgi:hypothetical protein
LSSIEKARGRARQLEGVRANCRSALAQLIGFVAASRESVLARTERRLSALVVDQLLLFFELAQLNGVEQLLLLLALVSPVRSPPLLASVVEHLHTRALGSSFLSSLRLRTFARAPSLSRSRVHVQLDHLGEVHGVVNLERVHVLLEQVLLLESSLHVFLAFFPLGTGELPAAHHGCEHVLAEGDDHVPKPAQDW